MIDLTKLVTADMKAAQAKQAAIAAVQAQIDQTERDTLMNRGAREGWLETIREKAAALGVTDDALIAAQNPFFAKLLAVDTQIRALRAQL